MFDNPVGSANCCRAFSSEMAASEGVCERAPPGSAAVTRQSRTTGASLVAFPITRELTIAFLLTSERTATLARAAARREFNVLPAGVDVGGSPPDYDHAESRWPGIPCQIPNRVGSSVEVSNGVDGRGRVAEIQRCWPPLIVWYVYVINPDGPGSRSSPLPDRGRHLVSPPSWFASPQCRSKACNRLRFNLHRRQVRCRQVPRHSPSSSESAPAWCASASRGDLEYMYDERGRATEQRRTKIVKRLARLHPIG